MWRMGRDGGGFVELISFLSRRQTLASAARPAHNKAMGRIILTIAGPWHKPPTLKTPFALTLGPADPQFVEDFRALAGAAESVDQAELRAIEGHEAVLTADLAFQGQGALRSAREGARLLRALFDEGGVGAIVQTGFKAHSPGTLRGLELADPSVLFHLFVEVLGDDEAIVSEGMMAFDLPDVSAPYESDRALAAGQAAVFGMAARMVCDRFRPSAGGVYRNSESAPLFGVSHRPAPPDTADDPFTNPRGAWVLEYRG